MPGLQPILHRWLFILACCLLPSSLNALPHLYYDDLGLISWRTNWSLALLEAQRTGKPLYIQMTSYPSDLNKQFSMHYWPDENLQKQLRRHCICFVVDYHQLPKDLAQILSTKGYTDAQCPIHLLLTPQKEVLGWHTQCVAADILANRILQVITDKRMRMSPAQEKEINKLVPVLQTALNDRDAKKIQATWTAILRIPGCGEARNKAWDVLDAAEAPARKKLLEAARFMREQKNPQAHLALDEARQMATALPIAAEIDQTHSALKWLDQAQEAERQAKTVKQKQQSLQLYQQLVSKYPETTVATLAYQKLRVISLGK